MDLRVLGSQSWEIRQTDNEPLRLQSQSVRGRDGFPWNAKLLCVMM
jgi:hypothetical protein